MLPSGLVLAGNSLLNSTDGNNVDSSDVISIPSTPAAFLAGIDADGRIASMQMIALAPGGSGGTIVSIPIGSAAVVAEGEQPRRVVDSYASGGLDALVTDVEGLLNVTFSARAALGEFDLATLLGGLREVPVEFDRTVTTSENGVVSEVIPAGRHTLNSRQVA
jgi:anionic cell wall polymer biosynthesis LytR-Cps2A-Psr (LCP) family protein